MSSPITVTAVYQLASFSFHIVRHHLFFLFFFNDTATTEIYTLSLHDALPIFGLHHGPAVEREGDYIGAAVNLAARSEEHTSELQSRPHLVCRLLLEKKKNKNNANPESQQHRSREL